MNVLQVIPVGVQAALGGAVLLGAFWLGAKVAATVYDVFVARIGAWFAGVDSAVQGVATIAEGLVELRAEQGRMQEYVCDRIENVHGEVMSRIDLSDSNTRGTIGILTGRVASIEMRVDAVEKRNNGNGQARA